MQTNGHDHNFTEKNFEMHPFFRGAIRNEAYTLTFGDRAENERGMQIIGKCATIGITVERLKQLEKTLSSSGMTCQLIDLGQLLPKEKTEEAAVLVIRNGRTIRKRFSSSQIHQKMYSVKLP